MSAGSPCEKTHLPPVQLYPGFSGLDPGPERLRIDGPPSFGPHDGVSRKVRRLGLIRTLCCINHQFITVLPDFLPLLGDLFLLFDRGARRRAGSAEQSGSHHPFGHGGFRLWLNPPYEPTRRGLHRAGGFGFAQRGAGLGAGTGR